MTARNLLILGGTAEAAALARAAAGRSCGSTASTAGMIKAQAIGFTNMTQRHPGPSVSTPPSRMPTADDSPATAPHTPRALFRSSVLRNVVVSVDRAAGSMSAAPSPWARRAPTNTAELPASPPVSEETATREVPHKMMVRRPITSARRPPSSMNPP